jgi:hypothetical protein
VVKAAQQPSSKGAKEGQRTVQELDSGAVGGELLVKGGAGGGVGGGDKRGADVDQWLGHGGVTQGLAQELQRNVWHGECVNGRGKCVAGRQTT